MLWGSDGRSRWKTPVVHIHRTYCNVNVPIHPWTCEIAKWPSEHTNAVPKKAAAGHNNFLKTISPYKMVPKVMKDGLLHRVENHWENRPKKAKFCGSFFFHVWLHCTMCARFSCEHAGPIISQSLHMLCHVWIVLLFAWFCARAWR